MYKFLHDLISSKNNYRAFPGGPGLKARPQASNAGGASLIPGQGTKVPHAMWCRPLPKNFKNQKQISK